MNTPFDRARTEYPIRVIQFGQGNFLRAFADDFIDRMNQAGLFRGSVAVVKTTASGNLDAFRRQNNRYTLCVRGVEEGKVRETNRIVDCVAKTLSCREEPEEFWKLATLPELRFVISNTTEAGIAIREEDSPEGMPESFPGKLTKFLLERYRRFSGDPGKGLILLPTELIPDNGRKLKDCVLTLGKKWGAEADFIRWLNESCVFCDTLVDRIVSGYPKKEGFFEKLGYEDALADVCEPFALWVIAAPDFVKEEFPLAQAGLPAIFTQDVTPYRERKVRILNGAHTSFSPLGVLMGQTTVKDCMDDGDLREFLRRILEEEIKPQVNLEKSEVDSFSDSVLERFENPFLEHGILSICLNSISKFRERLLPSFRDHFRKTGRIPRLITFSFAALLAFYNGRKEGGEFVGAGPRGGKYLIRDDGKNLEKIAEICVLSPEEYVAAAAGESDFWGEDLSLYPDFVKTAAEDLKRIEADPRSALREVLK